MRKIEELPSIQSRRGSGRMQLPVHGYLSCAAMIDAHLHLHGCAWPGRWTHQHLPFVLGLKGAPLSHSHSPFISMHYFVVPFTDNFSFFFFSFCRCQAPETLPWMKGWLCMNQHRLCCSASARTSLYTVLHCYCSSVPSVHLIFPAQMRNEWIYVSE